MINAAPSPTARRSAAADPLLGRIVYRLYGVLTVSFGALLALVALVGMVARATGNSFDGAFADPAAISGLAAPFMLAVAVGLMWLGTLVFERSPKAAVAVIGWLAISEAVEYTVPAVNFTGSYSFVLGDAVIYATIAILTGLALMIGHGGKRA